MVLFNNSKDGFGLGFSPIGGVMYILPPEWRGEVFLSCCVFGGFEGEDVHGDGCVGRMKVTWNFLPLLSKIKNIYIKT